jgi:hypothetical protein
MAKRQAQERIRSRLEQAGGIMRGAKGTRTPGLLDANQTLFQLSYSPGCLPTRVPGAYWLESMPGQDEPQA